MDGRHGMGVGGVVRHGGPGGTARVGGSRGQGDGNGGRQVGGVGMGWLPLTTRAPTDPYPWGP